MIRQKLRFGYLLGFEVAIGGWQSFFGMIRWALSPAWWCSAPEPGVTALASHWLRFCFTLATLTGYILAHWMILLAPRIPVRAVLESVEIAPSTALPPIERKEQIH